MKFKDTNSEKYDLVLFLNLSDKLKSIKIYKFIDNKSTIQYPNQ